MRWVKRCVLSVILLSVSHLAVADDFWLKEESKHFVVMYHLDQHTSYAKKIAREAEQYYQSIGDLIGYTKYSNFWTWSDRVKIVLYVDKFSFVQFTGQPEWSSGFATDHSNIFESKSIVSYIQDDLLEEDVLPHEISHLILHDHIGLNRSIPLWFDEGVAQLQEQTKLQQLKGFIDSVVKGGQHIPFNQLAQLDIRGQSDSQKVAIFYAQSLSVVKFMLEKYGQSRFQRFCRELKNGVDFDNALRKTYTAFSVKSMQDLEKNWLKYIKG